MAVIIDSPSVITRSVPRVPITASTCFFCRRVIIAGAGQPIQWTNKLAKTYLHDTLCCEECDHARITQ